MLAEEIAVIFIATQTNSSTFLWGSPGQGKSSLVRRGFSALGYRVHTIRLNTTLPHYLGGSPLPDQTNRTYDLVPPGWVRELNEADKSVLFLDDVTCAAPMVQTAALGLLDELEVAGITLKAIPIVAGNPNELATARFDLDAATANRCFHVWITSDAQSFKAAAEKGFSRPHCSGSSTGLERSDCRAPGPYPRVPCQLRQQAGQRDASANVEGDNSMAQRKNLGKDLEHAGSIRRNRSQFRSGFKPPGN
jgi:hypothetical protein